MAPAKWNCLYSLASVGQLKLQKILRDLRFAHPLHTPQPREHVELEEEAVGREVHTRCTCPSDLAMFPSSPGGREDRSSMGNAQWALPEFSGFTPKDK